MRKERNKNEKKEKNENLKIIPIGGLGLIGMNMTAFDQIEKFIQHI